MEILLYITSIMRKHKISTSQGLVSAPNPIMNLKEQTRTIAV